MNFSFEVSPGKICGEREGNSMHLLQALMASGGTEILPQR